MSETNELYAITNLSPNKVQKQLRNKHFYKNNKNTFKVSYIFRTYPTIETEHADEIADYLRTNGEELTDEFIVFLKQFIPPRNRPTTYNTSKPHTDKYGLPRRLKTILNNTPIPI